MQPDPAGPLDARPGPPACMSRVRLGDQLPNFPEVSDVKYWNSMFVLPKPNLCQVYAEIMSNLCRR